MKFTPTDEVEREYLFTNGSRYRFIDIIGFVHEPTHHQLRTASERVFWIPLASVIYAGITPRQDR